MQRILVALSNQMMTCDGHAPAWLHLRHAGHVIPYGVDRGCQRFGDGDIDLAEELASDWRVNNFDLLRLLAALQVAVVHSIGILKPTGYFASLLGVCLDRFPGVPIFFVISGVLISKSYERSDSLRDYLRNRCLRIFPGLWVCLVVSVAVILALGVGSSAESPRRTGCCGGQVR